MFLFKKLSFTFLILLLCFGFVEISLRIIAYINKKTIFSALTIDDPVLDWRLSPHYRNKKTGIYINSSGFRGKEFKKAKGNLFRIISVGDSCTFGVGAEGTTYPEILEDKLNSAGVKYEVINAAVPGYTSSQALLYLQSELMGYKPDLIVIYIGWNNLWTYENPGANTAHSPLIRNLSRTLSKSLAFTLLRDYCINPLRGRLGYSRMSNIRNDSTVADAFGKKAIVFKADLSKMVRIAKAGNCRVILCTLPTAIRREMSKEDMSKFPLAITWTNGYETFLRMHSELNDLIRETGSLENAEVVDLDYLFNIFQLDKVKGLFSDAVHPNGSGTEFIAQCLSQKILAR